MPTVACVLRSGGVYNSSHVQALLRGVRKFLPYSSFICLSDLSFSILGVEVIPLKHKYPGWWSKMELFRSDLKGDLFYLDLDSDVVGSLTDMTTVGKLTVLRDFYHKGLAARQGWVGSGLMYLPEEDRSEIWARWLIGPEDHMRKHSTGGDQKFLQEIVGDRAARWQDILPDQAVSYKVHVKPNGGRIPQGARVVCFHGKPRPWEAPPMIPANFEGEEATNMVDHHLSSHQRLRIALLIYGGESEFLSSRVTTLHTHTRAAGVRGPHATRRNIRRWLTGQGRPPAYWLTLVAAYLDASPELPQLKLSTGPDLQYKIQEPPKPRSGFFTRMKEADLLEERWATEMVYIIGGGPSAGAHDLTQLQGIIVAVNDSATRLPNADVIFTASPPWCRNRTRLFQEHRGRLVVRTAHRANVVRRWRLPEDAIVLPLRLGGMPEEEREKGHNSGHEALWWVVSQGAKRVTLVGFDMDQPSHWYSGYEWFSQREMVRDAKESYPLWASNMERTAQEMKRLGVVVTNANPRSTIKAFPYVELDLLRVRAGHHKQVGRDLTCAVIIPVGPGHEEFSVGAAASVASAWEYNPGPFTSLRLALIMDTNGALGCSLARNQGLDENPADWHFLLDADDEMMPDAFRLVDLENPATFGTVWFEGKLSKVNHWPVTWETLRTHGAKGTLSMGCWVRGDLGIRFQKGISVGEDFDFYLRLPGFTKCQEPLVNIGYRRPRAGDGEKDRGAVGWLSACRVIVDQYLGPPPKPLQE